MLPYEGLNRTTVACNGAAVWSASTTRRQGRNHCPVCGPALLKTRSSLLYDWHYCVGFFIIRDSFIVMVFYLMIAGWAGAAAEALFICGSTTKSIVANLGVRGTTTHEDAQQQEIVCRQPVRRRFESVFWPFPVTQLFLFPAVIYLYKQFDDGIHWLGHYRCWQAETAAPQAAETAAQADQKCEVGQTIVSARGAFVQAVFHK
uniref:Palmitoyltransferase n=1 Tax=Macrostomum lignano TaxID=282301 RepID=A0A1I8FFI0_9PLAT